MDVFLTLLAMLLLVACSALAVRRWPTLPLPLVQLAIGGLVALPRSGLHLHLQPDVFMALFIPPLLFASARRAPQRELGMLKTPILLLAVGLVVFTVLVVGAVAHLVLPFLAWPLCFLLAALLAPTDSVAFSAVVGGRRMPPRLLRILQGEALINDASGLVAVKLCLSAAASSVTVLQAGRQFVAIAGGGLLTGALFILAYDQLRRRLGSGNDDDAGMAIVLLELLAPFAPYLVAEHFGFSGVLAAVAAGLGDCAFQARRNGFSQARLQAQAVSGVLSFTLDGLVFILLGMQLPALLRHPPLPPGFVAATQGQLLHLAMATTAVALALLATRFVWIVAVAGITRARDRMPGAVMHGAAFRLAALGALGGMRGAISLAAALGLPFVLAGQPLSSRGLLVFVCAAVIVLSLLAGSVLIPLLLPREGPHPVTAGADREQRWARQRALRAALRSIEQARRHMVGADDRVLLPVAHEYRLRVAGSEGCACAAEDALLASDRQLRLQAVAAQRRELVRLRTSHRINDVTYQALTARADLDEIWLRLR